MLSKERKKYSTSNISTWVQILYKDLCTELNVLVIHPDAMGKIENL